MWILVGFMIIWGVILAAAYIYALSRPDKQKPGKREPQPSDYSTFGGARSREYTEAHRNWERHEAKRITYDLPLEEALATDNVEELYWLEVSKRNPDCDRWNPYVDYNSDGHRDCKVCGAIVRGGKIVNGLSNEGLTICNDCYASLAATRQSGNYELPAGITEFSPDLWIYQAIIAVDLDMGIIDEIQAERERKMAVAFVKRKLQKAELARKQKAQAQEAEQQRRDRISSAINCLHK